MDDDLRLSLRTAIRVWQTTAQRMEGILDDRSLTQREMLDCLSVEVSVCHRAMNTIDAELERLED